jgi:hypothetical protein
VPMHRRVLICLLAALALPAAARAADEIHWTFTGPTSVSFDWRGTETTVRYGLTPAYGTIATAVTPSPVPPSSSGPFWEARLTGLSVATTYHYAIGNGPDHTFHTPPLPGSSDFTVFAEGDIGDTASFPRVAPLQSAVAAGNPDFVLMVGDLTYANVNGQSAVDRHFNNVMKWSQDAAYMPVWGNHEWTSPDDLRNYKGRFDLPNPHTSPGAPSLGGSGEDWSWFDYGNVRFIAYPEPYTSASWQDWTTQATTLMDQAQADPNIRFIVTIGHRPAYSSGYHPGDTTLQGYLGALGDTHDKYVLNINGHSHDYERSFPQHGVVHVTAGPGGADLEESGSSCIWSGGCPAPSWSAFRAMHHVSLRLVFSANEIRGEALCGPAGDSGANINDVSCTPGTVLDSFTIGGAPVADVIRPAPITDLR